NPALSNIPSDIARGDGKMFEQVQTWWQNTAPETQAAFQEGAVLIVALLGGHLLGKSVARALQAKNFDAALRLPGSEPEHGITPPSIGGLPVRLTVWGASVSWWAHRHGRDDLASTLGLVLNRTWGLAALLVGALALGSLLASRIMRCLQGLPKA